MFFQLIYDVITFLALFVAWRKFEVFGPVSHVEEIFSPFGIPSSVSVFEKITDNSANGSNQREEDYKSQQEVNERHSNII